MKKLTTYLVAAALLASPALLVQAAEDQPAEHAQNEHAQDQQNTPNTPQTAPAPSEQQGGDQAEGMNQPSEGMVQPDEGMTQPDEPSDETAEQATTAGDSKFIEQQSGQEILASNLIGYSVTNLQNENVGQVDDLILDQNQRPVGMVISVGGFLGLGAKHVALPMGEIQIQPENKIVQVNFSKEELNKAPTFKAQKAAQNGRKEEGSGSGGSGM